MRGLNLMTMGQQPDTYAGPMIDGQIVTAEAETAFRAGQQAKVPYMVGANNREFGFMPLPPAAVDGMLARFGADKDKVAGGLRPREDRQQGRDRRRPHERRRDGRAGAAPRAARLGRRPADLRVPLLLRRLLAARKDAKGALHATEIPFVFETVRAKYGDATTPEDEALAAAANAYWVAFARRGDPNGDGPPEVAGATRRRTTS